VSASGRGEHDAERVADVEHALVILAVANTVARNERVAVRVPADRIHHRYTCGTFESS